MGKYVIMCGRWLSIAVLAVAYSLAADVLILCQARGRERQRIYRLLKSFIRSVFRVSGVTYRIQGLERLPACGPMIIAANHLSHFDAMALVLALPVQGVWIGKKELRYVPVVGWKLSAFECIFIDRGNHSKALASMSRAAEKTRNGRSVYIFPEGTRSRSGAMGPLKKGAFYLAVDSGVPLVPVYISGSRSVLAPDTCRLQPGVITVSIGNPIDARMYSRETIPGLMQDYLLAMIGLGADTGLPGA